MAHRVIFAAMMVVLGHASAQAGFPARAGISEALLGRWGRALDRLEQSGQSDLATRYFQAEALLRLGVRREALQRLRELSDGGQAFSGPALELAVEELFDAGKYVEVTEWAAASVAERFQDRDRLEYRVGQSYFLLGRYGEARTHLENVLGGPTLAFALHSLGLIHFAEGRLRESVDVLGAGVEAAHTSPAPPYATVLADRLRLTRGRVIYQVAVGAKEIPDEERARLFLLARSQFEQIRERGPLYADAVRGVGWCSAELDEAPRALGAFESAAVMDPAQIHEDLWAQGRVYQRLEFYDEAARFYGQAREAALETASEPISEPLGETPSSEAVQWQDRLKGLEVVRDRMAALEDAEQQTSSALEARSGRLARAKLELDRLRARIRAYAEELRLMGANLRDYLDQIPAAALFPRGNRSRIDGLLARQERERLEIARLEAAFSRLSSTRRWHEAAETTRQRTREVWKRLQATKDELIQAQLDFLLALKRRVSEREKELQRAIEGLRSVALSLDGPVVELESLLSEENERMDRQRERLAALTGRRKHLRERLISLKGDALRNAADVKQTDERARSRKLLLRADAYALDEAQALHLWRERRGTSTEERR